MVIFWNYVYIYTPLKVLLTSNGSSGLVFATLSTQRNRPKQVEVFNCCNHILKVDLKELDVKI